MESGIPVFRESPHPCPYLPEQVCSNLRFYLSTDDPDFMDLLLEKGFRHFGDDFFRPDCPQCQACVGIRIPVADFKPDRAQKRCLKKNDDLCFEVHSVVDVDQEHLRLLNDFQVFRAAQRDWPLIQYNQEQYLASFFWEGGLTHEVTARDGEGRLLAVGIVDLARIGASATYHYHDPLESHRGLGTWLILKELEWLKNNGFKWLYLGLWNGSCQSLAYKRRFGPHQLHLGNTWTEG